MMVAAVYVLLLKGEQVLLLRRYNTGYEDGNYSLIAGHLDGGEEVVAAAMREAAEEAGISLDPSSVEVIGVMHRRSDDERTEFFVTVERWSGKIQNLEPEKCDDLTWFPVNQLPSNIIPHVREAIELSRSGRWFKSYGWT
jgi:8-oxo-dGTP pyrophosphatase MutT (NUDIX family)